MLIWKNIFASMSFPFKQKQWEKWKTQRNSWLTSMKTWVSTERKLFDSVCVTSCHYQICKTKEKKLYYNSAGHRTLSDQKEGNCSGQSRVRRILLTRIQLLLLQFWHVISHFSKNRSINFFINLIILRSVGNKYTLQVSRTLKTGKALK